MPFEVFSLCPIEQDVCNHGNEIGWMATRTSICGNGDCYQRMITAWHGSWSVIYSTTAAPNGELVNVAEFTFKRQNSFSFQLIDMCYISRKTTYIETMYIFYDIHRLICYYDPQANLQLSLVAALAQRHSLSADGNWFTRHHNLIYIWM